MRLARLLTGTLLAVFLTTAASAQTTFFVDPVGGNNANPGSQGSPYATLTFALGQAAAGDSIRLRAGSYDAETLPIALKDRVDVAAFDGETPVFDGSGAAVLFTVGEDITAVTTLAGVDITDCVVGLLVPSGRSVSGLTVDSCNFSAFTDSGVGADDGYGVRAVLDSGGTTESLTISGCTFAGTTARAAISLELDGATTLAAGGFADNTCSGGVDRGIAVEVLGGATMAADVAIERNLLSGHAEAGILLRAAGIGGGLSAVSTLSGGLFANRVLGAGGTEVGLRMLAEHGVTFSEGALVDPIVEFNTFDGNDVNIDLATFNDGTDQAQILADFYGNSILDAGRAGVEIDSTLPNPVGPDNEPNFGPGHDGRRACINTFRGNGTDFRLGAALEDEILARSNFFPAGNATQLGGVVDTIGVLAEELTGSFSGSFAADTADDLTLSVGAGTAFVDYDGPGAVGQVDVTVDGAPLDQADILSLDLGAGLILSLPALSAGPKTVVVTNPGGQTGSFTLSVVSGGGGGGGAGSAGDGCFVATAAYGDEDAYEVLSLRRFRDHYLRRSEAGRGFIGWYYREGPKGADWLREHDGARGAARAALLPVAVAADGLTTLNPGQRLGVAVLLLGASFALLRRRR
ncbi:MAG: CFI-box-CTERM domain-containing protein [Planctomycetota bacterium]|jgi:hypothetical protein